MALTFKNGPPPAQKPATKLPPKKVIPKKLLKESVEKITSGKKVTQKELKKAAAIVQEQKKDIAADFLKLIRENKDKTDEELLEELRPHLVKGNNINGRNKESYGDKNVYNEKVLLAYRLKQRGLTYAHIGEQMNVTPAMVGIYLNSARDMLRIDPSTVDIPQKVGESMNFFADIQEMALMIASSAKSTAGQKLNAMRVALVAEANKNDFLSRVGVYAPNVMAHFTALVMNQFQVPSNDVKETGMEEFFTKMAGDLMQASAARKLQSIANDDLPATEYKDA